jgi:hypothetical protein
MGRVWGPGGWIGPGSRRQRWTFGSWWHFPLLLGMVAAGTWFAVVYFGLFGVGERSRHRLGPSLSAALFYGAVFGLVMLGLKWWERRGAERQR